MIDFTLTPEQIELQREARLFAQKVVFPAVWHYDKYDKFAGFLLDEARRAGFMNVDIPRKYGGKGLRKLDMSLIIEEIAAAGPGVATSIFDNSLGLEPLLLSKNEGMKERIIPQILKGKHIAFALSETGAGSDVGGIKCRAEKKDKGYVINGRKFWITNGSNADYFTVFATMKKQARELGIAAFLVEKERSGVTIGRHMAKMGQRASNTTAIEFQETWIPEENLLAPPPRGFVLAMKTFAQTRPMIGAFAVGAARTALDIAVRYSRERKTFGKELSQHQMIQGKLAEMFQKVETMRLFVWRSAVYADQGRDPTLYASMAKFYCSESAMEVINDAIQILGGYGYSSLFPLEKLYRDIRLLTIYEGTSEIQRMVTANHLMNGYQPITPPLDELPLLKELDLSIDKNKTTAVWRCKICGELHYGEEAPEQCPVCLYPGTAFKRIWPQT